MDNKEHNLVFGADANELDRNSLGRNACGGVSSEKFDLPSKDCVLLFLLMESESFTEVLDLIRRDDPRYDRNAYFFVRRALDYTLKECGETDERSARHVSGSELLDGIRSFALDQFGPLALTVFREWNVLSCEDFGEIVFQLVDYGVLGKTERDSRSDFAGGYDFEEAFLTPFLPEAKKHASPNKNNGGRLNPPRGDEHR